jgi:ribulose-phosphate 3-epimerase
MMARRIKISPSILSADYARLATAVEAAEAAGADFIHVDVMDGHYVPNITVGPPVVRALRRITQLPLDVHLMITEPARYIGDFAAAGAHFITIHVEAARHLHRALQEIRELGAHPGVTLNPATPAASLTEVLQDVDLVLVMTVDPGFGGQKFIRSTVPKIAQIRQMLDDVSSTAELEVDGGIDTDTTRLVVAAGATVLVAGNAIFGSDLAVAEAIAGLRSAAAAVGRSRTSTKMEASPR